MENETETQDAPVEISVVKPKQKRTSKTWLVIWRDKLGEDHVAKITGVTSDEEAVAKFMATAAPDETIVSVKPARKFK